MASIEEKLKEPRFTREQEEALKKVLLAARCIKHWHDDSRIGGMVVSAEHVRKLWKAIKDYDYIISLEKI